MDPWGVMASSVSNEFSSIPRLLVVNRIIQLFWLPSNPSWGDWRGEDKNGDRGLLSVVTGTAGFPSVIFGLLPIENYAVTAEPRVFSTGSQLETCVEHIVCLRLRICAVENTEKDQFVCGKTLNLVGQKLLKPPSCSFLICIYHSQNVHTFIQIIWNTNLSWSTS